MLASYPNSCEILAGPVDPCSDGPGSSDDFQPLKNEPESESDDELMAYSATKAVHRKKAEKGSIRRAVETERVSQGGSLSVSEGKRKAPRVEQVPFRPPSINAN
jgi:hypothetical protein